jgi:hypothetical protein
MKKWDETYWVVEALLAVNPQKPKWTTILASAVEGNKETKGRITDYWLGRFWTDILAWRNEEVARKEFGKLTGFQQEHNLRLMKVHSTREDSVVITVRI